jgi:hypothetical protein
MDQFPAPIRLPGEPELARSGYVGHADWCD